MQDRFQRIWKVFRTIWRKGQIALVLMVVTLCLGAGAYAIAKFPVFEPVRYALSVYFDRPVSAYNVYFGDELLGTVEDYNCINEAWNNAVARLNSGIITYKVDAQYTVTSTTLAPSSLQSELELQNNIKFFLYNRMKNYTNTGVSLSIGSNRVILKDMETVYAIFTSLAQNIFGKAHTIVCTGFENGQPIYVLDDAALPYSYDGILPMEEDSGKTLIGAYINDSISIQTLYVMSDEIVTLEDALTVFKSVPVCEAYRVIYKTTEELEPTYINTSAYEIGTTKLISSGIPASVLKDDIVYYQKGKEVSRSNQSSQVMSEGENPVYYNGTKVPALFIWPATGGITSYYGWRSEFGKFHSGLDIANKKYTIIRAAADGVVILAGRYTNLGNTIVIDHKNGYQTWYAHNAGGAKEDAYTVPKDWQDEANGYGLLVSVGDYVYQGQIIAYMGTTGFSTGYHLHFEITYKGKNVDPLDYLP